MQSMSAPKSKDMSMASMSSSSKLKPAQTLRKLTAPGYKTQLHPDKVYSILDPPFSFANTNYQFGLKNREAFHKYLDDAGFFDKFSNIIAKLYEVERHKEGGDFLTSDVAEYLHEQLRPELGHVPWKVQVVQARKKRDEILRKVEKLEKEKTGLMHFVETGERFKKKVKKVGVMGGSEGGEGESGSSGVDLRAKESTRSRKSKFARKSRMLGMMTSKSKKSTVAPTPAASDTEQGLGDNSSVPPTPNPTATGESNESGAEVVEMPTEVKSAYNLREPSGRKKRSKRTQNQWSKKPSTQ